MESCSHHVISWWIFNHVHIMCNNDMQLAYPRHIRYVLLFAMSIRHMLKLLYTYWTQYYGMIFWTNCIKTFLYSFLTSVILQDFLKIRWDLVLMKPTMEWQLLRIELLRVQGDYFGKPSVHFSFLKINLQSDSSWWLTAHINHRRGTVLNLNVFNISLLFRLSAGFLPLSLAVFVCVSSF